MSAPIPINKEKPFTSSNYFSSWFAAKKQKEVDIEQEEEIFVMDDDELPPKLMPNPPKENDLDYSDYSDNSENTSNSENELDDVVQEDYCFSHYYPCSNIRYYGSCKNCEDNICNIIIFRIPF